MWSKDRTGLPRDERASLEGRDDGGRDAWVREQKEGEDSPQDFWLHRKRRSRTAGGSAVELGAAVGGRESWLSRSAARRAGGGGTGGCPDI